MPTETPSRKLRRDLCPLDYEEEKCHREVGQNAFWSLSSCKSGTGIEQLRDNRLDTFWQSDGSQPHLINIQFPRKTDLKYVSLYCDFKADESYTPQKITVRTGTSFNDLQDMQTAEFNEPRGWVTITIDEMFGRPHRAWMLQIAIVANHQNGRDTHVRQVKIYAPIPKNPFDNNSEMNIYPQFIDSKLLR
ncbi:anaphase-promoting complex subunit 10-like [Paramacrobiotus metropolitanus]|uniref:anaphase-promoting complex subunit 10-like n=1 Tax=Paramacrobiotus metropolitanus TaxID=2943436 RepID=UPI0024458EE3|nr:anaphase-promoting complex subunit 10-like [Paramacrobiotus metropolitanus]